MIHGIEDALYSRYDFLGFDTSYFEFSYLAVLVIPKLKMATPFLV
jgi:hypothetical protein